MEEWGRFAETIGMNIFEVIDAIRVRPTHSNMRQPGFGVGGYCLTKDPLFAGVAARELFGQPLRFPFSEKPCVSTRPCRWSRWTPSSGY
jgi:UDP-N-acetyl-D-glucosamine dehydrogenase